MEKQVPSFFSWSAEGATLFFCEAPEMFFFMDYKNLTWQERGEEIITEFKCSSWKL